MKTIARAVSYLLIAVAVIFLAACNSRNDGFEQSVVARRTTRGASALVQNTICGGIPLQPMENKVWGEVLGEPPQTFNLAVQGLMSATLSPAEVGVVSGRSGDLTGVRFWGNVQLESGKLNSANMPSTNVLLNTAQFRIVIWDSLAGTEDSNGNTIPEYPIAFAQASQGTVSGNSATLVFSDTYGSITLTGTFDQNFYQGQISYVNTSSYSSADVPRQGVLGNFVVRTCGFFNCQ